MTAVAGARPRRTYAAAVAITAVALGVLAFAADSPDQADFVRGTVVSELARIVLPLAVLAWLATVHRLWRAWPTLLTAAVSSAALSALLWYALTAVPNSV